MEYKEELIELRGQAVTLITLKNSNQIELKLLSYGATMVELRVPDRWGQVENVVLTYENYGDYIENPAYFGATIGRTAGRMQGGQFTLDGRTYQLNQNYGHHHGHGGPRGFSFQPWSHEILQEKDSCSVKFHHLSKDEENYPGNLRVEVMYTLREDSSLLIEYRAQTDQKTLCNLTNHAYFNLSGDYKRTVIDQWLQLKSSFFLELNAHQIPTGNLIQVAGTPMDFIQRKAIGQDIETDYSQLTIGKGYDHPWLLHGEENQIEMIDYESGRKMSISTTYPCVVIYSYNYPKGEILKSGKIGEQYDGICFETQFEPDGINHSNFHSAILEENQLYYQKTEFKFSLV